MKDFDLERSTLPGVGKFRIAGHEFGHKALIPADTLASLFDDDGVTTGAEIEALDAFVISCLQPEYVDEWKAARKPDSPNPLTLYDIRGVSRHLLEVMSGRPTDSSSASGGTRPSITTTSTEESPSAAVA